MNSAQSALPVGVALGVTLAEVSNTNDPKNLGRIKVKFQLKDGQVESDWIQIISIYAGQGYGAFFMPKAAQGESPGDSALIAFASGDPSKPYVLGFLWNGVLKSPVEGAALQQTQRVIKTESGKVISFDDKEDTLTIKDKNDNAIVIDSKNNLISLDSQGDFKINAKGNLTIEAASITLKNTSNSVNIDLSSSGIKVNGGTNLKMNATMIDLN